MVVEWSVIFIRLLDIIKYYECGNMLNKWVYNDWKLYII